MSNENMDAESESDDDGEERERLDNNHGRPAPPPGPKGNDFAKGHNSGAPRGNDNAVGNSGGYGAPNNQNAAKHHLNSDTSKLFNWLEEHDEDSYQWILNKHERYLEEAPFGPDSAKSDRLLETCVCEYIIWQARGVQVMDGIIHKTHMKGSDGELVEVEDERPENQAVNRMDRQVMSKLNKMGIFDESTGGSGSSIRRMENDDYIIEVSSEPPDESDEDGDGE